MNATKILTYAETRIKRKIPPRSTTTPKNRLSFNDWAVMIRKENNKKYKIDEGTSKTI
tara:strand:+ start:443 stop:616 length:174 start_codon:yes stop_codon:yes gene_type:complete